MEKSDQMSSRNIQLNILNLVFKLITHVAFTLSIVLSEVNQQVIRVNKMIT